MNLPPDERRAVPRHIRDGEHHAWEDPATSDRPDTSRRRPSVWILLAILAVFVGAWVALRGGLDAGH